MVNKRLETVIKGCDSNCSDTDTWELCKVEIRNVCAAFGRGLSNQKRNGLLQCNIQATEAARELIINPKDQTAHENLLKAKQKMEIIQLDKARGAQIRARMKRIEEGERNTKYFCSPEKSRGKKKAMTKLRRTTGETTPNQREILQEQVYIIQICVNQSPTVDDIKEATSRFVLYEDMPTLDENDATTCEGKVTLEETSAALNKMKNGSAPGYHGITTEYIKFSWSKIGTLVTNSFFEAFDRELSYTQKQGLITLLHKGNKLDKEDLNNWRPITLTNTDYKVLAKVLAERLSGVIPKLVSEDQVGYIRGRNTAIVVRTVDDVVHH